MQSRFFVIGGRIGDAPDTGQLWNEEMWSGGDEEEDEGGGGVMEVETSASDDAAAKEEREAAEALAAAREYAIGRGEFLVLLLFSVVVVYFCFLFVILFC